MLTSLWYTGANMARAKNRGELRELLVLTSFIPFATGFGFNHEGSNDGGVSLLFHPRCEDNVMLPLTFQMFANILNVNMSMKTVSELYEVGFQEEEAKRAALAASFSLLLELLQNHRVQLAHNLAVLRPRRLVAVLHHVVQL